MIDKVYGYREINGATLHPMAAYLLLRGMKTLDLRIERQNANAGRVAGFLSDHPAVTVVNYPGLASHPGHVECSAEERAALGIPEGLIRYSAGIENIDDLLADLDQALIQV